jgi:pSer/pThr/pTyr-binding forkhead associated (FHA) protein
MVSNPPPLPGGQRNAAQPAAAARARQLYIIFNGQKIPVTKEEFVIGRGSKSADLAIKDGNISRRHAAVVMHNGAHYLKDLGSTNGVEFQGRRFDSKRIEEGDLFRICDYELRFTYQ